MASQTLPLGERGSQLARQVETLTPVEQSGALGRHTACGQFGAKPNDGLPQGLVNGLPETFNLFQPDFLAEVFRGRGADELIWIAGFPGDPSNRQEARWRGSGIASLDKLPLEAESPEHNTYVSVGTIKRGPGVTRRKSLVRRCYCVFLDDVGTKADAADALKLEPSWIFETSPGNYQVGYLLREPEADLDTYEKAVKALAQQKIATDPGAEGCQRYMRMPVGSNTKAKYGPDFPKVQVRLWEPTRRYTLDEIVAAYGLDLDTIKLRKDGRSWPAAFANQDPYVRVMAQLGLFEEEPRTRDDGSWHLFHDCPFAYHPEHGHTTAARGTGEGVDTSGAGYRAGGGFKCHHSHGERLGMPDLKAWLREEHGIDTDALDREQLQVSARRDFAQLMDGGWEGLTEEERAGLTAREDARQARQALGIGAIEDFELDFDPRAVPSDRDAALQYLNDHFFTLFEAGSHSVGRFDRDPATSRIHVVRSQPREFREAVNLPVRIGEKKTGERVYEKAGKLWLDWPGRHQFLRAGLFITTTPPPRTLNLWTGWGVAPTNGDWSLMDRHLREVVCGSDEAAYHFLVAWLARCVQQPEEPAETAIVMRGGRGAGKGFFARCFGSLFAQHFRHIARAQQIVGQFNDHLRDTIVLFADEAFFAGDRAHEGQLKALITEPTLAIEAKYQPVTQVPNMLHIIMASNDDWVVPAGLDERRFLVLDVSGDRQGDVAYFEALRDQMAGGGAAAWLHNLLNLDLAVYCQQHGVNLRQPPTTEALIDQKLRSLKPHLDWWHSILRSGVINEWRGAHANTQTMHLDRGWPEAAATQRLFQLYLGHCERMRVRYRMSEEELGTFLNKTLELKPARPRNAPIQEINEHGLWKLLRARKPGYRLPPLTEARGRFEQLIGASLDWGSELPDEPEEGSQAALAAETEQEPAAERQALAAAQAAARADFPVVPEELVEPDEGRGSTP